MLNNSEIPKIFGIGFQKTGTTTLDYALRHFDLRPVGYSPELIDDIKNNNFIETLEKVGKADVFQDNPWPVIFKELDRMIPGSKFILTERNVDSWYKSMLSHFGKDESRMRQWIYGAGSPVNNESLYKNRFIQHNKEVKEYFQNRTNDLLVVNWEEGDNWEVLCPFLGLDIPKIPFPHVNKKSHRNFFMKSFLKIKKKLW